VINFLFILKELIFEMDLTRNHS